MPVHFMGAGTVRPQGEKFCGSAYCALSHNSSLEINGNPLLITTFTRNIVPFVVCASVYHAFASLQRFSCAYHEPNSNSSNSRLVARSVYQSVIAGGFCSCPNCLITASARPHADGVTVYPTLFTIFLECK